MNIELVGLAPFALLGLGMAARSVLDLTRVRFGEWRETEGEILESSLGAFNPSRSRQGTMYRANVVYRYRGADTEQTGRRVALGDWLYLSGRDATLEWVARYSQGARVTVYYLANKPSLAVLERRTLVRSYVTLIAGSSSLRG
jgi:hypothetical protein